MATNSNDEFEVVDASTIQFVKRGRKSNIDPALVTKLKTMKPGEALLVRKLALDANASDYKTAKARVSANIRSACVDAGMGKPSIRWSVDGVPMVVR